MSAENQGLLHHPKLKEDKNFCRKKKKTITFYLFIY